VIDTEERLTAFLPLLKEATWVAVDTEADSLHAYPEKVCLIQLSTSHGDRLVDPLAGINLDPFLEALSAHELLMHGADYDLRLLRKHHEFVPKAIFDTMLAARLLGYQEFGLSSLVERHLGVRLEKGQQKANWAIRPLSPKMEEYARKDTHYLKRLSDHLQADLEAKGRVGWHQESCERLILESGNQHKADPDAVWRVKGSNRLERPALAVLRELWRWRESEALGGNKPPFFVLSHQALSDIAVAAARDKPLDPLLPRHLSERRRSAIHKAVARGRAVPPELQPRPQRFTSRRPTEGEKKRYLELQKRRDERAAQLCLDPTVIASRATLSDLAHDWDTHVKELMSWQRELLAQA
jgi:ribonuclease D